MDSDAQHNPSDIPKLATPIIKGEADMVNGSRYLSGKDKNTPAYRRVGQTVLDKATNINSAQATLATTMKVYSISQHQALN
jgi:hypothetical protein